MRNALTYGALGGGALLAGGQAIREQEDPGSIFLAGLGGGAGAIGGLGAARGLAGKFAPQLVRGINRGAEGAQDALVRYTAPRSSVETKEKVSRPFSKEAKKNYRGIRTN